MTQISKRQLARALEGEVYDAFWMSIVETSKKEEAEHFFGNFFTRTERVNFAKRLAIAILLYKGYDWRQIRDLIAVSLSTIGKVAAKVEEGSFKLFFEKLEKNEKWKRFWTDLAKAYFVVTHGDKVARFGDEWPNKLFLKNKTKTLL